MPKTDSNRFPFTDLRLKKLQPQAKDYDCRDEGCPGLALRVSPAGKKTFRWTFRDLNGKHRVKTLGTYPTEIGLAEARAKLEEVKAHHQQDRENGTQDEIVATVADLAELFYKRRILKTRKRPEEARAVLDKDIIPKLGKLKLQPEPKAPTIGGMIAGVVERGAPVHAGKVLDLTRQLFDFAVALGYMTRNPAAVLKGTDLGVEDYTPRDRSLTAEEIRTFWQGLDQVPRLDIRTKLGFKLLLLTGVRSQELRLAKWDDLQLDGKEPVWVIPVASQKLSPRQAKTAKDFIIPLTPQVVALFKQLEAVRLRDNPWVLGSEDAESGHYSDKVFGRALRRLFDKTVKDDQGREVPLFDMEPATPHDLRRTMRTQLGEVLKVEPHIAERCLNHSLGKLTATYDTGAYLEQRREAMTRWADQVDLYVDRPENVLLLRGAA